MIFQIIHILFIGVLAIEVLMFLTQLFILLYLPIFFAFILVVINAEMLKDDISSDGEAVTRFQQIDVCGESLNNND